MGQETAAAFLSYAHVDDENDGRSITALRVALESAVRVHAGVDTFKIFQDRRDLAWGDAWRHRLDRAIDSATFLIPVLTPSFFQSVECRRELGRFLRREQDLGRNDLVRPIYYIRAREMESGLLGRPDDLAAQLLTRQYVDWRETRVEDIRSVAVRQAIAKLADLLTEALWASTDAMSPAGGEPAPGSTTGDAPADPPSTNDQVGAVLTAAKVEAESIVAHAHREAGEIVDRARATATDIERTADGEARDTLGRARSAADQLVAEARDEATRLLDDARRRATDMASVPSVEKPRSAGRAALDGFRDGFRSGARPGAAKTSEFPFSFFTVVDRGYDTVIVGHCIRQIWAAQANRLTPPALPRPRLVEHGYDPAQVDRYLADIGAPPFVDAR